MPSNPERPVVEPAIDKAQARRSFERAADGYDDVALLQREVGARLLERLEYLRVQPEVALDLGCGTGLITAGLMRRYPGARVYALDFAEGMLRHTRRHGRWLRRPRCVCGDMESLPLADASVDMLCSNLAFQWATDRERLFAECRRVLRPGGVLMFTTFGPDTLRELREAWQRVDGMAHVNPFADMHDIGDELMRAGFADPVMDVERMTLTYGGVMELMRDLKQLGARNVLSSRRRGLTGKAGWRAMAEAYEAFRRDGRLPASYEVVHGQGWVVDATQRRVPLDSLFKR